MDDSNRRVRIDRLLWRFSEKIVLKPLPLTECATIIERWLEHQPVRFSSQRTRAHFIRHVARVSGGIPAAIRGMLEAAQAESEITPAKARSFHHEASAHYLDMTPVLVILMVVFLAMRYISRGLGDMEMLVLSGVVSAIFIGLRFFMFRMSAVALMLAPTHLVVGQASFLAASIATAHAPVMLEAIGSGAVSRCCRTWTSASPILAACSPLSASRWIITLATGR